MSDKYIFEGPDSLAEFLLAEESHALKKIKEKIPPMSNICVLKKSLGVKPCGCKGKDPKVVMKQREERLNNFYKKLISGLSTNFNDKFNEDLKSFVKDVVLENQEGYTSVVFKLENEVLLEI